MVMISHWVIGQVHTHTLIRVLTHTHCVRALIEKFPHSHPKLSRMHTPTHLNPTHIQILHWTHAGICNHPHPPTHTLTYYSTTNSHLNAQRLAWHLVALEFWPSQQTIQIRMSASGYASCMPFMLLSVSRHHKPRGIMRDLSSPIRLPSSIWTSKHTPCLGYTYAALTSLDIKHWKKLPLLTQNQFIAQNCFKTCILQSKYLWKTKIFSLKSIFQRSLLHFKQAKHTCAIEQRRKFNLTLGLIIS